MDCIRIIIENITTFVLRNEIVSILFLVVYMGAIIGIIKQILLRKCNRLPKLFAVLLSFSLAFGAYKKVSYLMDTWLVFQISDKCYATENRIEDKIVTPSLINEGGSASAYKELVRIYQRTEDTSYLKGLIKNQLSLIYDNVEMAQDSAKVEIWCLKDTQWKYKEKHKGQNGNEIEWFDDFDVRNIIAQLRHPTYWLTRLTSAKYLMNKQYLEKVKNIEENFELLKDGDYAKIMYENLVFLITKDSSLSVRKSALDTFIFWACLGEEANNGCRNKFTPNNIYNFDISGEQWEKKIVENFNKTIGLRIENYE